MIVYVYSDNLAFRSVNLLHISNDCILRRRLPIKNPNGYRMTVSTNQTPATVVHNKGRNLALRPAGLSRHRVYRVLFIPLAIHSNSLIVKPGFLDFEDRGHLNDLRVNSVSESLLVDLDAFCEERAKSFGNLISGLP
uniref:WS_DGAT_C domain-containing protein n=1 Tax=Heterorhabditis bacteriophora TaxID=37862 RepID=A0A1I7XDU2_HETBA